MPPLVMTRREWRVTMYPSLMWCLLTLWLITIMVFGQAPGRIVFSDVCNAPVPPLSVHPDGTLFVACGNQGILAVNGTSISTLLGGTSCRAQALVWNTFTQRLVVTCTQLSNTVINLGIDGTVSTLANNVQCSGAGGVDVNTASGTTFVACKNNVPKGAIITIASNGSVALLDNGISCNQPTHVRYMPILDLLVARCENRGGGFSGLTNITALRSDGSLLWTVRPPTFGSYPTCKPQSLAVGNTAGQVYFGCEFESNYWPGGIFGIDAASGTVSAVVDPWVCLGGTVAVDPVTSLLSIQCHDLGVFAINLLANTNVTILTFAQSSFYQASVLGVDHNAVTYLATASQQVLSTICVPGESLSGNPRCTACFEGTFSNTTDQPSCTSCPPGLTSTASAQICDIPCDAGAYCPGGRPVNIPCPTGFWSHAGQASCTPCPLGTVSTILGAASVASCRLCFSGSFSDHLNSTACTPCQPGTFSEAGASFCDVCGPGTYQPDIGGIICHPCPASTYSYAVGLTNITECLPCPIHLPISPSGSSSILQCVAPSCSNGVYTRAGGIPCETICPQGRYCIGGQLVECPSGTANSDLGSSSISACIPCDIGTYSSTSGSTVCIPCPSGSFQDEIGSSFCSLCPPNTYQPIIGASNQTACLSCPPTSPVSPPGAQSTLQCIASICPDGFYSPPLQPSCSALCPIGAYCQAGIVQLCPIGTANSLIGSKISSACIPCSPGSYTAQMGNSICTPCPIGSWQDGSGQSTCIACRSGTYGSSPGSINSLDCNICPTNLPFSPTGSTSIMQCVQPPCTDGFYTGTGDIIPCKQQCPIGAYCLLGIVTPCPPGSYSNTIGASSCTPCGIGFYGTSSGSSLFSDCAKCPLATWSDQPISSSCHICTPGNITIDIGSSNQHMCIPIESSCRILDDDITTTTGLNSGESLCMLSGTTPIILDALLPQVGLVQLNAFLSQFDSNSKSKGKGSNSSLTTTRSSIIVPYTPISTASSLRISAFGQDTILDYHNANNAASSTQPESSTNESINSASIQTTLPSTSEIALLIVLITLALLPLALYRLLPARAVILLDRFSWHLAPTAVGAHLKREPTQFGGAWTITFIMVAVVLVIFLDTAPNKQTNTALVPPSTIGSPGTAITTIEITIRAFMGIGNLQTDCPTLISTSDQSTIVTGLIGFSDQFHIRVQPDPISGSCLIAADCTSCTLTGLISVVNFNLPHSAQLLEWELWLTGAAPESWSRRYGILTQQPGSLMDAAGKLTFSLIEAYYSDRTTNPSVSGSGYELTFGEYITLAPQSIKTFNGASHISIAFELQRSTVIFETTVLPRLSPVQIFSSILSAVLSLFAAFGIIYAIIVQKVMPRVKAIPGRVIDQRENGGICFIVENDKQSDDIYALKEQELVTKTKDHDNLTSNDTRSESEAQDLKVGSIINPNHNQTTTVLTGNIRPGNHEIHSISPDPCVSSFTETLSRDEIKQLRSLLLVHSTNTLPLLGQEKRNDNIDTEIHQRQRRQTQSIGLRGNNHELDINTETMILPGSTIQDQTLSSPSNINMH